MGPKQVLPLEVRVDLGVMIMKEHSTISELQNQSVISDGLLYQDICCRAGGLTPLQRYSWHILQLEQTGLSC